MRVSLILAGLAFAAESAVAKDSLPSYGFEFVTIGDPGNRDTIPGEVPLFPETRIGGVEYEYQMATTEVTIGQYLEFVEAYLPIYERNTGNQFGFANFTGTGIRTANGQASIRDGYSSNRAANMSWEYAARYVNWLHNGKTNEESAFETGVYDTSTFVQNAGGVWQHQETHSSDARFWIPTRDEWVKAAYWDPEKNQGEGGYWRYQNGSDIEPVPGLLPEDGGERNAGGDTIFPLDVLSFAEVMSPWGLFDMAGGESEFLESLSSDGDRFRRALAGSHYGQDGYGDIFSNDIIGYTNTVNVDFGIHGLRIASSIPGPGSCAIFLVGIHVLTRRER